MTKSQTASQVIDHDTICYQWRKSAVIVDRASSMVEFRHCHVARKSIVFPKTQPYFACAIADLKAVHFTPRFKNDSAFLTVVTATGKANIPDMGTNFASLSKWFTEAVPSNAPEFATDNPLIAFTYVLVGVVCLFATAFQVGGYGNAIVLFAAVFGAALGVVGTHLLVRFAGSLLKTDITLGIFAIVLCLAISAALGALVEWYIALSVGIVLTGAFVGVMYSASRWFQ